MSNAIIGFIIGMIWAGVLLASSLWASGYMESFDQGKAIRCYEAIRKIKSTAEWGDKS